MTCNERLNDQVQWISVISVVGGDNRSQLETETAKVFAWDLFLLLFLRSLQIKGKSLRAGAGCWRRIPTLSTVAFYLFLYSTDNFHMLAIVNCTLMDWDRVHLFVKLIIITFVTCDCGNAFLISSDQVNLFVSWTTTPRFVRESDRSRIYLIFLLSKKKTKAAASTVCWPPPQQPQKEFDDSPIKIIISRA